MSASWSMAAMLRDSTTVAVAVAVVVVVRTRPRAIPLAMIHMRKSIHRFPFFPLYGYGAPLGGLRPPELRYKQIILPCQLLRTLHLSRTHRFIRRGQTQRTKNHNVHYNVQNPAKSILSTLSSTVGKVTKL